MLLHVPCTLYLRAHVQYRKQYKYFSSFNSDAKKERYNQPQNFGMSWFNAKYKSNAILQQNISPKFYFLYF
jgi:hypothetical protein